MGFQWATVPCVRGPNRDDVRVLSRFEIGDAPIYAYVDVGSLPPDRTRASHRSVNGAAVVRPPGPHPRPRRRPPRVLSRRRRRREDEDDTARFRAAYRSHHTDAAADLARFRAVSRSCLAAVREQLPRPPRPRRLPWTVLIDGSFITALTVTSADDDTQPKKHHHHRRFPSWPEKATCIGATNEWLAVECVGDDDVHCPQNLRSIYHLRNPFSGETVPLPEIDAVIEADSAKLLLASKKTKLFKIRKVLMRSSSPGDVVVAVLTNNYDYPLILVRPGKGAWSPRPRSAPFIYIVDVVFLGDKLYGITKAEDLISLDLAFDAADGKPTVTGTRRLIRHEPKADDLSVVWGNADFMRVPTNLSPLDNAYDLWSDVDERYRQHEEDDVVEAKNEIMDDDGYGRVRYDIMRHTGDDTIKDQGLDYDDEGDSDDPVITSCHLLESLGKLLMVRRKWQWVSDSNCFARTAQVFEASITTGTWMPVTAGLDGQALFISRFNNKSVHACGELVVKDAVYVADTGDVLSLKSRVISKPQRDLWYGTSMWIFPPEVALE